MDGVPSLLCEYLFGAFRFDPARQLLLQGEAPVRLGARALELLHALVERSGELVAKDELMDRIWPDTSVTESNLKVQVAALRRALGDGRSGMRYIATANGRGYRFVAPVERRGAGAGASERDAPAHNLPDGWVPPLGRDEAIDALRAELAARRFGTIVGPAGIGKTTVAIALAHASIGAYADGIWLVELAALRDPDLVPSAIATALGVRVRVEGGAAGLMPLLRDRQMLLLLDCCEHLVGAVAAIAETLVRGAPGIHLVATSREPLRAKGEVVHRLEPLATPLAGDALTAAEAARFPAVQLFVERAASARHDFAIDDADAAPIAEICRRLDGIALAIELAARRVDAFTPSELLVRLTDRFALLTHGLRTAPPHHQTLAAAIGWSYDLLPEAEQILLCRLSIFQGAFAIESAVGVAGGDSGVDVVAGVGDLVTKSLVAAESSGDGRQYRLLDSTRAYARQKLDCSGQAAILARRHAEHHLVLFRRAEAEWPIRAAEAWLREYGRCIDDVRAALDWAFSDPGDAELGAQLAAASVPLWTRFSLVDECRRQMERALDACWDRGCDGGRTGMKLSAALAAVLLQTRGPAPRVREAWRTAAATAARLGDRRVEIEALWGLCDDHTWRGEHRAALAMTERIRGLAAASGDRAAQVNVGRQAGTALRYLGQLAAARDELERMIRDYVEPAHWTHEARFQVDPRIAARGTLANILWLQGDPGRATALSRQALDGAKASGHALTLCNALAHTAIPIALYVGDDTTAEHWLEEFFAHTARHAMPVWDAVGRCLRGILWIRQHRPAGLEVLRQALEELAASGFRMRFPAYLGALASGLGAFGRRAEARATIEEALTWSDRLEELWCKGELLRIKGELLRTETTRSAIEASRECCRQALICSRRQGALSWELRATASLTQLWPDQARAGDELVGDTRRRVAGDVDTTRSCSVGDQPVRRSVVLA